MFHLTPEHGKLERHLEPGVWAAARALDELLAISGEVEHLEVCVRVKAVKLRAGGTNLAPQVLIHRPLQFLKCGEDHDYDGISVKGITTIFTRCHCAPVHIQTHDNMNLSPVQTLERMNLSPVMTYCNLHLMKSKP